MYEPKEPKNRLMYLIQSDFWDALKLPEDSSTHLSEKSKMLASMAWRAY